MVAGAGTGKTAMLSERYLHHLSSDGLSPLGVVAVTFTERAADELRSRIRARAQETEEESSGIDEEAVAELEAAQISTIHALCSRILREHPEEAGVPPDFTVLDELTGSAWAAERLLDALDALPADTFTTVSYESLLEVLPDLLADPVAADEALAHGPERWEERAAEARVEALERLLSSEELASARALLQGTSGAEQDKMEEQRSLAVENLSALEQLSSEGRTEVEDTRPYLEGLDSMNLQGGKQGNWAEGELPEVKAALKTIRGKVQDEVRKRRMVSLSLGPADERLADSLRTLKEALSSVSEGLARAKRRARALDFADLEAHALKALEHESVRDYYRQRWRAVLVDEFQDTNPVQARILERLSEGASLTIVGDEQQSIYGFRRAEAEVFKRFRERIVDEPGGEEVVLSTSFRTHGLLVEKMNAVFEPVLEELHRPLDASRESAPHEAPHMRAFAVDAGDSKAKKAECQRVEAAHLARTLRRMIDEGMLIHDPGTGGERPVRPGDMALLSRVWGPLGIYGEALASEGIPAVHAGGGNLLETREAKDGLALLRFLADTSDDVALAAVLRGPYFAVEDAALQRLSEDKRKGQSWWDLIRVSVENAEPAGSDEDSHLRAATEALGSLLAQREVEPPSILLEMADRLTGYTAVISNLPGGERRMADWRGLRDLVRGLEGGAADVYSVTRDLRAIEDSGASPPRPALEAGDAVTLTTIHSGKGLEWPVVVIPDLARVGPNHPPGILFEPDLGAALDVSEDEEDAPVLYRLIHERRKRREEAEARRVFYVASTRARDHLILSSTEGVSNSLCGLTLLAPGLDAAGTELDPVAFSEEDSRPPEQPPPEPGEAPELLVHDVLAERQEEREERLVR